MVEVDPRTALTLAVFGGVALDVEDGHVREQAGQQPLGMRSGVRLAELTEEHATETGLVVGVVRPAAVAGDGRHVVRGRALAADVPKGVAGRVEVKLLAAVRVVIVADEHGAGNRDGDVALHCTLVLATNRATYSGVADGEVRHYRAQCIY